MLNEKSKTLLDFIKENPWKSSKEIFDGLGGKISYATVKRILTQLLNEQLIQAVGHRRGTKYQLDPAYTLFSPIEMESYFLKEIDDREIIRTYNPAIIKILAETPRLFTTEEETFLQNLQNEYTNNIAQLSETAYNKELERLAIDLSWKSSEIEGNTYSLLETERLLKEKETAQGKTKDDATMLLNHKEALDFLIANPDYTTPLKIASIEDIHSLLIKDLGVDRNIRTRRVGISGTNYTPIENEFQIREALLDMCHLVNTKNNVFEKALLVLLLISYIQPFNDGNKRTARIMSNAVLMNNKYCPISFRTIDAITYKKAMLLFYEQNNLIEFKKIFISQFEFAVKTYF